MGLFMNKEAKVFLIRLSFVLLAAMLLTQASVYMNSVRMKQEMLEHDYELAGYLIGSYPQLAEELPAVFTSAKSNSELEAGKELLETAGYKSDLRMQMLPAVNSLYQKNAMIHSIISGVIIVFIFLITIKFMKSHFTKIDRYQQKVYQIMNGDIEIRLDDQEEGSLGKLASSINTMTSSLHTHIKKEKHNRLFLKETLTNVSHQLKTPLSAMVMYNEIMQDEPIDNEVIANFLRKSERELERMQTLITNLLKLAKLDAGIIQLHKMNCILNDVVKQAVESFETRVTHERKAIEITADETISYPCDREWLLEAVSNLIKNAIEHTSAGSTIQVHLERTPLIVKISVRDDGEGIHPADLHYIFKPFYRSRFSQNKQGTGIGLSLAKTVVELHGGFIAVESLHGKGAVFHVNFPCLTKL